MPTTIPNNGTIQAIAVRDRDGAPMREVREGTLVVGGGFTEEPGRSRRRGVTLVSAASWANVCAELHVELPWYLRRANLLISHLDFAAVLGATLRIGETELVVHGETKPCRLMDQTCPGLRAALEGELRGGVHAEVVVGGVVRVGDPVIVVHRSDECAMSATG